MIEVFDLVRRYGDFAAVDDVSFQISPGEVVGLLGHNGAGKTTIMKMLTGYLEPSSGTVEINGLNIQDTALQVQAQIGYLPESPPIYPEMTVTEYLAYAAQLRGVDAAPAVAQAIHSTQLQDKAGDVIDTLSRGYKQRVGVAQAILHQPQYLILDEPSNGLDPNQIQQMRLLIKQLAKNATVILSTHIMQEVDAVCDRAIILRNGRIAVDQKLSELRATEYVRLHTEKNENLHSLGFLQDLNCINALNDLGSGQWQLAVNGEAMAAVAVIAEQLVGKSKPIYELSPVIRDLEMIFREVNNDSEHGELEVQHEQSTGGQPQGSE